MCKLSFYSNLDSNTPLIRTEYRRLRDFFQHFHPKCNINWGFRLFLSAYKPKPKNIFFGPQPAVQSPFIGKWLGLEQNLFHSSSLKLKFSKIWVLKILFVIAIKKLIFKNAFSWITDWNTMQVKSGIKFFMIVQFFTNTL